MRITDQYFWNVVFVLFFATLVAMGAIILDSEAYKPIKDATVLDITLITFATFRIIRFFIYDTGTKFFREQFWNAKVTKTNITLSKPKTGPRRTIADLLSCPWYFGIWASAMMTFFYFLTPFTLYFVLFLAVSAVATFLQLLANMIGWRAEQLKNDTNRF